MDLLIEGQDTFDRYLASCIILCAERDLAISEDDEESLQYYWLTDVPPEDAVEIIFGKD